jgi:hypothetical protein
MERRIRPTIIDGEVVTFALGFSSKPGPFGDVYSAEGPFEVSGSRNTVIVHRAYLGSDEAVERFIEALRAAQKEAHRLTRDGWGGNYRISDSASEGKK